jgi:hypothetical protein
MAPAVPGFSAGNGRGALVLLGRTREALGSRGAAVPHKRQVHVASPTQPRGKTGQRSDTERNQPAARR